MGFVEDDYPWIACDQCQEKYCTLCNEPHHHPRTCDDVRREKELEKDPKHRAHEAMSKACKRFCPHCNQEVRVPLMFDFVLLDLSRLTLCHNIQQYMKSDGCNKITCKCKLLSCYLCGDKIQDYSHFCNHNLNGADECPCGKVCRLWTSTKAMEEIDRQRRHAAGREVLSKAGYTDEKEILSIIASPPAKKQVANEAAAQLPAARAQQPNNPVRPPQVNPADAAWNVQQPPTPNRRMDPLMEQAWQEIMEQARQVPLPAV